MSIFTYNGVTLPYPFHEDFTQSAVYDGTDETEKIYTKFDITLSSVINVNYLAAMGIPNIVASGPANIMRAIRIALLQPRRLLSVTVGGVELIPINELVPLSEGNVDAKNGPLPQSCSITQLTNETFLIKYHIIAHYWENAFIRSTGVIVNSAGGSVLYNRWSETVEIDDLMMSTRTREGRFIIRSDNPEGAIADHLRIATAVVGVPEGFMRFSSKYTVSPNGLSVSYTIVDKEVFKMPPTWVISPSTDKKGVIHNPRDNNGKRRIGSAYRASGRYHETTQSATKKGDVLSRTAIVELTLWGAKSTKQHELIGAALSICNAKLIGNSVTNMARDGSQLTETRLENRDIAMLTRCDVIVGMYENYVIVRMCALLKPRVLGQTLAREAGMIGTRLRGWTFTPGSDGALGGPSGGRQPVYNSRGTAGLILQAAAYYDASLQGIGLEPNGQFGNGLEVGEAGVQKESKTAAETNVGVGGPS